MDKERLYDEYYGKIYVYIVRRINNTHDAEDLTADVFLKAFGGAYNSKLAGFSTYIFRITQNVLKNYYRDTAKRREMIPDQPEDGRDELADDTDIIENLIAREEYEALKAALAQLPPRQYDVIYRRYYLDESFREIGVVMQTSESNARQLHFEALKKIKNFFKHPNEIDIRVYKQVAATTS